MTDTPLDPAPPSVSDARAVPQIPLYSKAFEAFVEHDDDTVGLLAYALFKQTINEDARNGVTIDMPRRNPGTRQREIFRDSAHRMLEEFGTRMTMEAKPTLQRSALWEAINGLTGNLEVVQENLVAHINDKTKLRYGVYASLIGWFISIVVTIIIVLSVYVPNWQGDAVKKAKDVMTPPAEQPKPPSGG